MTKKRLLVLYLSALFCTLFIACTETSLDDNDQKELQTNQFEVKKPNYQPPPNG